MEWCDQQSCQIQSFWKGSWLKQGSVVEPSLCGQRLGDEGNPYCRCGTCASTNPILGAFSIGFLSGQGITSAMAPCRSSTPTTTNGTTDHLLFQSLSGENLQNFRTVCNGPGGNGAELKNSRDFSRKMTTSFGKETCSRYPSRNLETLFMFPRNDFRNVKTKWERRIFFCFGGEAFWKKTTSGYISKKYSRRTVRTGRDFQRFPV